MATSRLARGRVPAALRWSELHTGTQSVHVLPPPPRRPWRVRTVARANSVPLSCAVTSLIRPQQGHSSRCGGRRVTRPRTSTLRRSGPRPKGGPSNQQSNSEAEPRREGDGRECGLGPAKQRADRDEQQPRIATAEQEADPPLRCRRDPKRRHPVLRRHRQHRAGRGGDGEQARSTSAFPRLGRPDRKPRDHRRVGEPVEHAVEQGASGARPYLEPGDRAGRTRRRAPKRRAPGSRRGSRRGTQGSTLPRALRGMRGARPRRDGSAGEQRHRDPRRDRPVQIARDWTIGILRERATEHPGHPAQVLRCVEVLPPRAPGKRHGGERVRAASSVTAPASEPSPRDAARRWAWKTSSGSGNAAVDRGVVEHATRAEDGSTGWVLKLLRDSVPTDRFEREVVALRRLNSARILVGRTCTPWRRPGRHVAA